MRHGFLSSRLRTLLTLAAALAVSAPLLTAQSPAGPEGPPTAPAKSGAALSGNSVTVEPKTVTFEAKAAPDLRVCGLGPHCVYLAVLRAEFKDYPEGAPAPSHAAADTLLKLQQDYARVLEINERLLQMIRPSQQNEVALFQARQQLIDAMALPGLVRDATGKYVPAPPPAPPDPPTASSKTTTAPGAGKPVNAKPGGGR